MPTVEAALAADVSGFRSLAGIQGQHARRLRLLLAALDTAAVIEDMDIPGFRLRPRRA